MALGQKSYPHQLNRIPKRGTLLEARTEFLHFIFRACVQIKLTFVLNNLPFLYQGRPPYLPFQVVSPKRRESNITVPSL